MFRGNPAVTVANDVAEASELTNVAASGLCVTCHSFSPNIHFSDQLAE